MTTNILFASTVVLSLLLAFQCWRFWRLVNRHDAENDLNKTEFCEQGEGEPTDADLLRMVEFISRKYVCLDGSEIWTLTAAQRTLLMEMWVGGVPLDKYRPREPEKRAADVLVDATLPKSSPEGPT